MRICKNCNIEMVEGYKVKVNNATLLAHISIDGKNFSEKPKAAICPKCGEVSIFVENIEDIK
ncbi:MAG: nucleic acid-binding protein [Clostridiaceae bacterium]